MKRGKPIPPKVRAQVLYRSGGVCEAKIQPGCMWFAKEMHHLKSRGRGGSNDPNNIFHICPPCHHKITIHFPGTEKFRKHSWEIEGSPSL